MDIFTVEETTKHEYYNHWININFVEYPMGRPKQLGVKKMPALCSAIWNDPAFWLPLFRHGVDEITPEEMAMTYPEQYERVMELMNDGLVAALNVTESTADDWEQMQMVTV